jgi:DNA-directed RNA polymerase II subunit RPB1
MRPKALWTGKQIFSLIIPKINMVRGDDFFDCEDDTVLINNGELLSGILNKSSIGKSSGGMIHIIWKEKGPEETKIFMSMT